MTNHPTAAPREERSYLAFAAAALAFALGAGLLLGLLIPTSTALGWPLDEGAVVDAHGTVQVAGWLGLYAAGMALRLVPRFLHRPPFPSPVPISVLALVSAGILLRLFTLLPHPAGADAAAPVAAGLLEGAGLAIVGAALAWSLYHSRGRTESWRPLLWAASVWWMVWAALTVIAGAQAAARAGSPPPGLEDTLFWIALLGAVGNLIWVVQARSVPIFYGRLAPQRLWAPGLAVNLGTLALLVAQAAPFLPVPRQLGLGLAGAGTIWVALTAGAVRGTAHRLRPPSRPAARFVLAADRWAVLAGVCLVAGAMLFTWLPGVADRLDEAALHLFGLGLATTLIVGMTRLLAPVFAIRRALTTGADRVLRALWWALVVATSARLAGALLQGLVPGVAVQVLLELAGTAAWAALALFALDFVRAWRSFAASRSQLTRAATSRPGAGPRG